MCLGKLQKIKVIMMLMWKLFVWTWYHQDAYRTPLMTGGWMTLTSVDTKDSAQFLSFLLGILTIGITAGTGYEAFCNTGPYPVRVVWRGLTLIRPFLYFSFNSVLECEITVCLSTFYSWIWSMQYWKFLCQWSCLCDSLQDQGSKVLVAHSPTLDFFVSKQDKWVGPQMQTWMMLERHLQQKRLAGSKHQKAKFKSALLHSNGFWNIYQQLWNVASGLFKIITNNDFSLTVHINNNKKKPLSFPAFLFSPSWQQQQTYYLLSHQ